MGFQVGDTVGVYRITEQIGQGGMATVFRAYHPSLDRYVAIKVLHSNTKEDESFFLRFQREAQIVAKLDHPHIVPVYDFAAADEEPYIVMKFIEGQTLKHRMKSQALTLQATLHFIPPIAEALTYAHDRGVLHRDIKPSNVMLDKNEHSYLADFGLARLSATGESSLSQDVLIGTPNYISPEQAKGEHLTPATDIYSLGVMLYEIVVGRVPFSGDSPYAVIHDHIYKPLPRPTIVNPTVPPEVEAVLLKALAKDPEERFLSANQMMHAFRAAVEASNLSELSQASVQLEKFTDMTPAEGTLPTSKEELNSMIKAAVQAAIPSPSQQTPTPTPYATLTYGQSSPRVYRSRRARRSFWILAGIALLVFLAIASLGLVINAINHPIVQNNPALAEVDDTSTLPPDDSSPDFAGVQRAAEEWTLEEAQAAVDENPDDPFAHLILALRYREIENLQQAGEHLGIALSSPDMPAGVIAGAAATTAAEGFNVDAMILWLAAYHRDPNNVNVRNAAGQYLYRQVQDTPLIEIRDVLNPPDEAPYDFDSPFTKAFMAEAVLSSTRVVSNAQIHQAQELLDEALQENDTLAEAHLIYGNLYQARDQMQQARESWRFAASFVDSPQWVQREAKRLLTLTENE